MRNAETNKRTVQFPLGIDIFAEIRRRGFYYADKTWFIKELLSDSFHVSLITRPRRFGKTVTMSMLEDFFDIGRDSKEDFRNLAISGDERLCGEWMNRWPVVFLTLKSVSGNDFVGAYGMLRAVLADICKKYAFLEFSDRTDPDDRNEFRKLKAQEADEIAVKNSLYLFTRMLHDHYGRQVIVLIDEYDVPLAKAKENDYYDRMLEVIRAAFDKALKSNEFLKFAVVTGCLKIAKESVFTGLNNLVADTISDERYDEYIGFTKQDVEQLLTAAGLREHEEKFREWYDGYRFGSVDVYCPWNVLNYARDLQNSPDAEPQTYWANTGENYILRSFLRKAGRTTKAEIETLIAGGSVVKRITEQLTYSELDKNISNLWSVLYMTGYLTKKKKLADWKAELIIPNREICEIFVSQIQEWFEEEVVEGESAAFHAFCQAFTDGNIREIEKQLNLFLAKGISIRDTFVKKRKKENFYHGLLLGLFLSREDWFVHSNSEDGDGYSDIHVEIEEKNIAFVIEIKYAENDALEEGCAEAMKQIEKMRYAQELRDLGFETVYAYGIAFYKKRCKAVCQVIKDGD